MNTFTIPAPDALSPWQKRAMGVPENADGAFTGGRGGGKTRLTASLMFRHCEQYGAQARCLIVRKSFPGLQDLESELRAYFFAIYNGREKYDQQRHRFTFPNGATIQLDQLETEADFQKYQGKSFTHIAVDEAGQYASPALVDRLRSSLRAPVGVPTRFFILANPGGPGHAWIAKRHALRTPWVPYTCEATGATFVTIPSTLADNPFVDQVKYAQNLKAACATDPELAKAWLEGDWTVLRGAYFASVLDENRVMVEPWSELPRTIGVTRSTEFLTFGEVLSRDGWYFHLAHDFGVSAPCVTYWCARSPGANGPDGRFYPKGSVVLFDEFTTALADDPNRGSGLTVPDLADRIKGVCAHWGVHATGFADDAIFNRTGSQSGTIAEEFRRAGVYFQRARKGSRLAGWETMRRMLQDAGKPDVPGLYVSRTCRYWWETVPSLPRDPRRPEDVDSASPDHAADACRYGLTGELYTARTLSYATQR